MNRERASSYESILNDDDNASFASSRTASANTLADVAGENENREVAGLLRDIRTDWLVMLEDTVYKSHRGTSHFSQSSILFR